MDARTLSVDDARELALLRRRAYAPDGDIADDPAAVRRLHQLEEQYRISTGTAPSSTGGSETGPPDSVPPTPVVRAEIESETPASDAEGSGPVNESTRSVSRRRWWRRIPVWSIVAIALVVGIAVGAAGISVSAPRADVVLHIVPAGIERDAGWQRELRTWGISPDSAVAFDAYNGVGVWTALSDEGSRCLILENGDRPINATCVGGGFDPVLDVTMYGGLNQFFDAPPPAGSVIRFIAREDAVEVWVRERQSVAAAASARTPSSR